MSPFRILGIKKGASILEIKRAYAAKLKRTRPEDDAVAFQRLREAFEQALASARQRDAEMASDPAATIYADDTDDTDEASGIADRAATAATVGGDATETESDVGSGPYPLDQAVRSVLDEEHDAGVDVSIREEGDHFNFQEFIAELQRAGDEDLPTFQRWLDRNPFLYSLSLKDAMVWPLMEYLAQAERPLLPKWLAAVLHFFRLDTVASRPWELERLIESAKEHAQVYWLPEAVAHRFEPGRSSWTDRLLFRELQSPAHRGRRAFVTFWPGLSKRTWIIADELASVPAEYYRRVADPGAVAFWLVAGDPTRVGGRRAIVMAITVAAVSITMMTLLGIPAVSIPVMVIVYAAWWLMSLHQSTNYRKQAAHRPAPAEPEQKGNFDWGWWLWIVVGISILGLLASR